MKKLALGALFAGLAAACGGGSDGDDIIIPPDTDGPGVCNPINQTGCVDGEKCTWIIDQMTPRVGHIGCVADGTVPTDGACVVGAAGPQGFDDCLKGNICISGECKVICDPQLAGVATGCDAQHSCSRYSGTFVSGGMITAGACDPQCDPLDQNLLAGTGNTAACGSTDPAMPNKGCYTFNFTEFSCAGASDATKTDRVDPERDEASGDPFVNGCAAGYVPLFFESGTVQETRCSGSCAVAEIDNTTGPTGHVNNDKGDVTRSAKLVNKAAPAVGDGLCVAGKKGSASGGPQECVFLWSIFQDPPNGQYDETLGFCLAFTQFKEDTNNNNMIDDTDLPQKNCNTFPPRSAATTMNADDAADFGCQLKVNSMLNGRPSAPALRRMVRPAFGPGSALKHSF